MDNHEKIALDLVKLISELEKMRKQHPQKYVDVMRSMRTKVHNQRKLEEQELPQTLAKPEPSKK